MKRPGRPREEEIVAMVLYVTSRPGADMEDPAEWMDFVRDRRVSDADGRLTTV